jgi:23S rRNA (guanosine2251-2'-O)-methyltransferase
MAKSNPPPSPRLRVKKNPHLIDRRGGQGSPLASSNFLKSPSSTLATHDPSFSETQEEREDLVYGRHSVLALLKSDRQINRIWLVASAKSDRRFSELLQQVKKQGTVIDEVTPQRLDILTQQANHQGIAAQVAPYRYWELDKLLKLAKQETDSPVIIIADGIEDPHNLGAIVRTAEAMGIQGLIIPQRRAVGVTATVMKVAAGALENLAIARVINLSQTLEKLKESGFWIYGTTAESGKLLHKTHFSGAIGLVVGSEGKGLSSLVERHCDELVTIPLQGKTPSLNASVATAIAIYEICRQKQVTSN